MSTDSASPDRGVRGRLRSLAVSDADFEAAELKESATNAGATHIDCCGAGQLVTVSGTLRSVTLRPVAGIPAVEAELYDGSGTVLLTWLGRRRIHGIEPGRVLTATGRMNAREGIWTIFNPRYALRALSPSH